MRVLAAALLVLLAGCARPLASTAELDRPSVPVHPPPFDGAPLWLNGTAHVSPLPPDAGALLTPGEPHNCFSVRAADGERASYLGGVILDLEWNATGSATQELNATVAGPASASSVWEAQGPSPLRLVAVAGDGKPVRTPFTVQLRPAGGVAALPEQPVLFRVMVGVLESELGALGWDPCGVGPQA